MAYTGNMPSGINAANSSTNILLHWRARDLALPRAQAPNPFAAAAGNTPAPATPAREAGDVPQDTPAKRGRGRPKGSVDKRGTQPILTYRCRYGCAKPMKGHVALRRHMMRVHGIFSNEHDGDVQRCDSCARVYSPKIKECPCNKGSCKQMSAKEELLRNVEPPRDDQEMADTFAYANVGPHRRAPSELVVVLPGHVEEERRDANALAIRLWATRSPEERDRAAPVAVLDNTKPATPETTPSKSSQTPVDLTGEEEGLPVTPGPSRKRAAEEPLPEPASKRIEVAADATSRRDSFDEAMAFLESFDMASIEPALAPAANDAAPFHANDDNWLQALENEPFLPPQDLLFQPWGPQGGITSAET